MEREGKVFPSRKSEGEESRVKFIGLAFSYVYRNIWHLLAFAVVPGIFYALNNSAFALYNLFAAVREGDMASIGFSRILGAFSLFDYTGARVIPGVLAVVFTVVFAALVLSFIERHMRIGKRTFSGFWRGLNHNIVPTCWVSACLIVFYEAWAVSVSGLLLLVKALFFQPASPLSMFFFYLFVSVVTVGMYVFLCWVISVAILWLPCLIVTGFGKREAFAHGLDISAGSRGKLMAAVALPFLGLNALAVLCTLFAGKIVALAFSIVVYIVYFMYYTTLMFAAYFHLSGTEREDLRKLY